MAEAIVGMFWNLNEQDLLPFTLPAALEKVDQLFIADDGSTDGSWEFIQDFQRLNKDNIRAGKIWNAAPMSEDDDPFELAKYYEEKDPL